MNGHFVDYYKILETSFGEDLQMIKKSYRRLALKYHPDVCKESYATQKFLEIQEAWEILSNNLSRDNYNKLYEKHNSINRQTPNKEEDISFERTKQEYSYYKSRAQQEAIIKSKLSFKVFTESIGEAIAKGVDVVTDVYAIVAGIVLVCSFIWGLFNGSPVAIVIVCFLGLVYGLGFYAERKEKQREKERKEKWGW